MADLIITFTRCRKKGNWASDAPDHPVPLGRNARSEAIAIGSSSARSTLSASSEEEYVVVYPKAACWVAIGADPTAAALASGGTAAGASWYLEAGAPRDFAVGPDDKVAVIEA